MKARPFRYFLFSLAKELGMTVQMLLANTTSRELAEWQAYFKIQNEEHEKQQSKRKEPGKVTADSSQDLSEALKAQLAIKKG